MSCYSDHVFLVMTAIEVCFVMASFGKWLKWRIYFWNKMTDVNLKINLIIMHEVATDNSTAYIAIGFDCFMVLRCLLLLLKVRPPAQENGVSFFMSMSEI